MSHSNETNNNNDKTRRPRFLIFIGIALPIVALLAALYVTTWSATQGEDAPAVETPAVEEPAVEAPSDEPAVEAPDDDEESTEEEPAAGDETETRDDT